MRRRFVSVVVVVVVLLAAGAVYLRSSTKPELTPSADVLATPQFVPVGVRASDTQPGLTLTGTVKDPSGQSLVGASVFLAAASQQSLTSARCGVCDELLLSCRAHETHRSVSTLLEASQGALTAGATTVTDEQGRFRFEHLLGTSFTVWATAAGHGAGVKERAAPGDPVELFLPAPRSLGGVLKDEAGRPVVGVVRAVSRRLAIAVETRSAGDGSFELTGLGEGPFYVSATAPRLLPTASEQVEAGANKVVLTLPSPRRLEVHLLARGQPIDGVVILHGNHLSRELPAKGGVANIDALYPQELMVSAVSGELSSAAQRVALSNEVTSITLSLEKGGRLSVSVIDEASQPVPEPLVQLLSHDHSELAQRKLKLGELGGFGPLSPGDYEVIVTAEGFSSATLPVAIKSGAETSLEVPLNKGVVISGRVIDEYGRPAPGVSVLVTPTGDSVVADAEGRFRATVPSPGLYVLQAHHSDWGGGEVKVTAPKSDVDLQLEPKAGAQITVTIDGRRVEGAQVVLFHRDGNFRSDRPSGADGVVLMRGLPTDTYTLIATHPDYLPSERQTLVLQDGVLLKANASLKAGASITGQVIDTVGTPVSGVPVSIAPRGAEPAITDAEGKFVLQPLRPKAVYSLRVAQRGIDQVDRVNAEAGGEPVRIVVKRQSVYRGRVLGDGQVLKRFRVDSFEVSSADGTFELPLPTADDRVIVSIEAPGFEPLMAKRPNSPDLGDFELKKAPLVTGVVRDESGAPVPAAVVSCDSCEQSVLTGADGRFSLAKPAFQHEFKLGAKKGKRTASRNVTDTTLEGLELVLTPGVRLSGTAYLPSGQVAAGVEIAAMQVERSEALSVVTSADGSYALEVPAGTYRFMLSVPGFQARSEDPLALITQVDGTEQHLDFGAVPGLATVVAHITPQPGFALWLVRGEVASVGNPPMELLHSPWAQLVYQPHTERVTFAGLPPGRYTLVWASFHATVPGGPIVVRVDVPTAGEVTLVR